MKVIHSIFDDLECKVGLIVGLITTTLILFLIIALLTIDTVIATVIETDIAPGKIHCRSEQVLTDDAGHKWSVMFFTEVDSPEVTSLNLRLSGLYSSTNIEPQKPLIISSKHERYKATDMFLENPPLPSIGQYNLKNIFPRLSTTDVTLEIPLTSDDASHLTIPTALIREWQEVANQNYQNYHPFPELPCTFEFMC